MKCWRYLIFGEFIKIFLEFFKMNFIVELTKNIFFKYLKNQEKFRKICIIMSTFRAHSSNFI